MIRPSLVLFGALATTAGASAAAAATPCPPPGLLDPAAHGTAGPAYPKPRVTVRCTRAHIIIESNGIPGYAPERRTPNRLAARRHVFRIPRRPIRAARPGEVPFLGPIAVTVTGLPIYAPNEAGDLGHGDAKLDGILDSCGGHVGPRGVYHFHARPGCPFDQAKALTTAVLGYAFDGHPIMAPFVCADRACRTIRKVRGSWRACGAGGCKGKLRKVRSSWRLARPAVRAAWDKHEYVPKLGDLDRCNGMPGPDGRYRYYATDSFPYNLGCYRGRVDRRLNDLRPGWSARATFQEPRLGPGGPPGTRPGRPPMGRGGRPHGRRHPDLGRAARTLGIDVERLRRALGPPPPNLRRAARQLGIDARRLRQALEAAR